MTTVTDSKTAQVVLQGALRLAAIGHNARIVNIMTPTLCIDHNPTHRDCPPAQNARMEKCGLVFYERQLDRKSWIGPPGHREDAIVKVLPLSFVQPKPFMEVQATDGERYLIPYNFRGTWFDVISPKGVKLVA